MSRGDRITGDQHARQKDLQRGSAPDANAVDESDHHSVDLFVQLAENSLLVADHLRSSYVKNTAAFTSVLRTAMRLAGEGKRTSAPLTVLDLGDPSWSDLRGETVAFVDGGMGQVRMASQSPLLVRVGAYRVRIGERNLRAREEFGFYPVVLGQLDGGSKERHGFADLVRITAELLSGLSVLQRSPDLRVLLFHGPLVSLMGLYTGHQPFSEADIDLFLHRYALDPTLGRQLKEDFLAEAQHLYPAMTAQSGDWVARRLFEPLAWLSFLYRALVAQSKRRTPAPLIGGVVERGHVREFVETIVLPRVFAGLKAKGNDNYFNQMYGRTDLTSPATLLDRLGYTDTLLLRMLLAPGQASESWPMDKYGELGQGTIISARTAFPEPVSYASLRDSPFGFPAVQGFYVSTTADTDPVRVEMFAHARAADVRALAQRVFLYARLLPGYGFPVGLDIADKYAHVPDWLTRAYGQLIRYHLGVQLQQGAIDDEEMRRLLIQMLYVRQRDWLFRPQVLQEASA